MCCLCSRLPTKRVLLSALLILVPYALLAAVYIKTDQPHKFDWKVAKPIFLLTCWL